jgi:spore germination protein
MKHNNEKGECMDSFHKWLRGEKSFSTQEQADIVINGSVSCSMSINLEQLSKLFSGIPELVIRSFPLKSGQRVTLVYMEGLVDKNVINTDVLRPLLFQEWNEKDFWESSISIGQIKKVKK